MTTSIKKTFPVLNMSCASCAISVESMVKAQNGVVNASVNFAAATLLVEYLPGLIQVADIRKAVQSIGYDLFLDAGPGKKESLEEINQKKYNQLKGRTIGAGILSVPVVVIGMFFMDMTYANEIMWILATPVVLWFGKGFFINAWKQAKHRSTNMDTLVALSTGVAYLFSVFNTLFPHFWHERGLHGHVYFEAAAVVIAFILLGKLLEEKARGNTSAAIKKLMGLQPKNVTVVHEGGHQMQIPIEEVNKGDIILVKPGEKIAVDGMLINGRSFVDESMLSGEPVPVLKKENDEVFAGTINQKGSFQFRAEKVGAETMLAQIIRMVQDAQGSKAPVQKLVDKIAGIFVPVVIVIAVIAFVSWNILGGENGFTQGLLALVTVLVIACPCALGLATPTALMVGSGMGAKRGILIRKGEAIQTMKEIKIIVFDKTGTITKGKPEVREIYSKTKENYMMEIAASLEKLSEHPLSKAIVDKANLKRYRKVTAFRILRGRGLEGKIGKNEIIIGNTTLMNEKKIPLKDFEDKIQKFEEKGYTAVIVSENKKVLGIIGIADAVKEDSLTAIFELNEMGFRTIMITGDNERTAKAIAEQVGIKEVIANVLPEDKAKKVEELQKKGMVSFVGDGINDAPALKQSNVGIAMGTGTDIAIESGDIVLANGNLSGVVSAIKLSRATFSKIKQNLFWAFAYNTIAIPVAIAGLLHPVIAEIAMALSSITVVSNANLLRRKKI